ncbi:MAG: MBL fold metallo-hydrolase [Planctomycetaceae bacterium]
MAGPHWTIESAEVSPLFDGDRLATADGEIEVIHTPGHTMGSVCFKFNNYLFSGDHVLPNISPNVGGGDLKNRGLLSHYLDSLAKVRDLTR